MLTSSDLLGGLPELEASVVCIDLKQGKLAAGVEDFFEAPVEDCWPLGDNLAYIIYTSGSTGLPKGVAVSQAELAAHCCQAVARYELSARDSLLHLASAAFDVSFEQLLPGLFVGAGVIIAEGASDCLEFHNLLLTRSISVIDLSPAYWREWLQMLVDDASIARPAALRIVIVGGEAMPASGGELWQQSALSATLVNAYGPTEATITALVEMIEPTDGQGACWPPPIGRPLGRRSVFVQASRGELVSLGGCGELCLGGAGLARGYLNQAGLTAERFIPDSYCEEPGRRLYRTGDLARHLADGRVQMLGRIDQQVKLHGFRIEPGEIEAQIGRIEAVEQAVVVMRRDRPGEPRLVAYFVARHQLSSDQLRQQLAQRLPHYMPPSDFIQLDSLPVTAGGKIDRKALPAPVYDSDGQGYEPPRNEIERLLCGIWAKMLGLERVGIRDNFFELGGDSILSIQIIARARKAGIRLTLKQFFQHQLIAELAQVAELINTSRQHYDQELEAEQLPLTGELKLTPIQQEFLGWEFAEPNYYNQAVMLGLKPEAGSALVEQALSRLLLHHDALRLRCRREGDRWVQSYAEPDGQSCYLRRDLSRLSPEAQREVLQADAARVQASLDLSRGPIVRVAEYDLGAGGRRLLMVIHHLAVDGVSWRILLEDMERVYEQMLRGEAAWPGEKTTSYRRWAERLKQYADNRQAIEQASYWVGERWQEAASGIAIDDPAADNRLAASGTLTSWLSEGETEAVLKQVARAYRTQINDVLLTALALAYRRWTSRSSLVVEMEGHGREDEFEQVDVTRTVGWFTSVYPVLVDIGAAEAVEALNQVKQQLRQVPARGLPYGVVKYLSPQQQGAELEEVINEIRKQGRPQISFNYLGQVDQVLWESKLFGVAEEGAGPTQSGQNERGVELEITAVVVKGRLRVDWRYGRRRQPRERLEELGRYFEEAIRELIAECRRPEAAGYAAWDFPGTGLSQQQLVKITIEHGNDIEAIYELSGMQQGMLFHTLYEPEAGAYFEQVSCRMEGDLDEEAFRSSWEGIVERHAILRTSFAWEGLGEPLQIVHRRMDEVWQQQDWRGKTSQEQEGALEQHLEEDRRKGFDLSKGPLMRVALIRLGEKSYYLVWSSHHALYDGWSKQVLIQEVFSYYEACRRGGEPRLGKAREYREYIEWLRRQDEAEAEAFWRKELSGISRASELEVGRRSVKAEAGGTREKVMRTGEETTRRMEELARRAKVTMSTIVEAAWAIMLSRHSGEKDVVMGVTVSGRTAPLDGIEEMVGLLINTLPLRVEVREEQEVEEYLRQVQRRQARVMDYEYSPLMKVQGWSEVGPGRRLFETIVVVQNYPSVGAAIQQRAGKEMRIEEVRGREKVNYPLMVMAAAGKQMTIRVSYDERRYEEVEIERVTDEMKQVMEWMAEGSGRPIGEVVLLSEPQRQQVLVEWNDTAQQYKAHEGGLCVHEMIERQARLRPDAVALEFLHHQLTYSQLNHSADLLADFLLRLDIQPEDCVAICLDRGPLMVTALLAVLKARAAYVPLDPGHPPDRLAFILEHSQARLLLSQRYVITSLPPGSADLTCIDLDSIPLDHLSRQVGRPAAMAEALAYVIYTSGSTGLPKGVAIDMRP